MIQFAMGRRVATQQGRRRILSAVELTMLLEAASARQGAFGSLRHNATGYRLAIEARLLAGELTRLTVADVRHDEAGLSIFVGYGEQGREIKRPISARLATDLDSWLMFSRRSAHERLLPTLPAAYWSRMLLEDLAAARQAWIYAAHDDRDQAERLLSDFLMAFDRAGRLFDFRSLRFQHLNSHTLPMLWRSA